MLRISSFFLLLATASAVSAQAPGGLPVTPAKEASKKLTIAHIELKGGYSEANEGGSLFSDVVETLSDVLQRLKKAANDDSLDAVILHIDGPHIGWAKLNELRTGIAKIRAKGTVRSSRGSRVPIPRIISSHRPAIRL